MKRQFVDEITMCFGVIFVVMFSLLTLAAQTGGNVGSMKYSNVYAAETQPAIIYPDAKGPFPPPKTENVVFYDESDVQVADTGKTRDSLVEYVYKYSRRISRSQVKEIVDAALETEHPALILALLRHESNYNPAAVSPAGAVGLGQIVPRFHAKKLKEAGIIKETRDLYEISTNMKATSFILKQMHDKAHGNLTKTLISYYGSGNPKYRQKIGESFFELDWLIKQTRSV